MNLKRYYLLLFIGFIALSCTSEQEILSPTEPQLDRSNAMLATTSGLNTIVCNSASEIQNAMKNAKAGDVIRIEGGTYTGSTSSSGNSNARFYSSKSGTAENPIVIEAYNSSDIPVLKGSSYSSNYVMYITGKYWVIKDLRVKTGKKGIMLDNSDYTKIDNVEVDNIGEEGIHLRDGTSNTEITNCYVHHTGKSNIKYGEGIYIGSDNGKWGTYRMECNYNKIRYNTIGPYVRAEHIDIKEGTKGNTIEYNTFDGKGMNDTLNGGLSFIDVKGNANKIRYNYGKQNGNSLLAHAFEVHDKVNGWGDDNIFKDNEIDFDSGNTSSYVVKVDDLSSVSGSPSGTTASGDTRSPSGNMYDLN